MSVKLGLSGTQAGGVRELGAEGDIWADGVRGNGGAEKTT